MILNALGSSLAVVSPRFLTPLDYVVIGFYFALVLGIGWWVSRKQETGNFLLAGGNIPWWAAGISLYAAGTSAISVMAIPAKTFATDWTYYCVNIFQVAGYAFIALWIIPPIHRLKLTSTFEYLERRFNHVVRLLGSAVFIISQVVGRNSVILLLPSLALATVAGINVTTSVLVMGVVTILYTAKGGFKAVIWTEVMQVGVLLGSVLVALGIVVARVDGGILGIWKIAHEHGRTKLFEWNFQPEGNGVWIFFLTEVVLAITFIRDQSMLQRVFATKDVKSAVRSLWTLNILVIPGSLMFFSLGTVLFAFYKAHPERLAPGLANDAIVPYFIANEMPTGVVGLVFAGLCAATMSALSGSINSISTAFIVDFLPHIKPDASEHSKRLLNRVLTVIIGAIGIGMALLLARFEVSSLFDTFQMLLGILSGGFGGVFALGFLTKRANATGAIAGTLASLAASLLLQWTVKANPYLYMSVGVFTCMGVGYVVSLLFPSTSKNLTGLTIWDGR
jgi:solute:Na+ symporter, SSS family